MTNTLNSKDYNIIIASMSII